MKIALSWLKEYISLNKKPEEIAQILTATGLEVEGLENYSEIEGDLEGVVIGEVLTCEKHPNADKLRVTTVDVGQDAPLPIVCGAPNVAKGQKVAVGLVGTTLYPVEGDSLTLKKAKIRGEISQGMICAEDELGIGTSHDGIMVLSTNLPNGTPFSKYYPAYKDTVIEIGLTPNRVDAASHWGVARDLRAVLEQELIEPNIDDFKVDNQDLNIQVEVENTEACPRYSAITISDVKVKESPKWLQNWLKAIGLRPINNVVDVTNFVLHELGQPLHAFDADEIKGQKVIVKTLAEGSTFITLDEVERKLSDQDLMICNEAEGMCIAGVFGGVKSGVTEKTSKVFLESAYFNPDFIRKTSLHHSLKTDASFRYERGADPNITILALKRAASLIRKLTGGTISSEIIDIYPNPIANFEFEVEYAYIHRLIGTTLDNTQIYNILKRLDIKILEDKGDYLKVAIPPYRVDVKRPADLVEEILRIYGYDNVPISMQNGADALADFPLVDGNKIQAKTTEMLAARGFSEMMNNSLTKPEYADYFQEKAIPIYNPLSEDLAIMRQSLLFSGLESIAYNLNRKQKDLKLFEFGRIYEAVDVAEDRFKEETHLSLFLTGNQHEESWMAASKEIDFHDLKAEVQLILSRWTNLSFSTQTLQSDLMSFGLEILYKKKVVGVLGAISGKVLKAMYINQSVFYADFNWDELLKHYNLNFNYQGISKFPEVRRDLSLVLDKKLTFREIESLAKQKEKKLLKAINIFDVYEGDRIEEGKKAYALSFVLQDFEKTLTDKAINKVMDKLEKAFTEELGALIRR